jgi:predicted dehydrogenase
MRVGMIGTGYWAREVHGASTAQHPDVEFVGIWGRNPTASADLAGALGTHAFADPDALIAEVDALTFAVPPDVQAEIATRAAAEGRHLLLEKPIALSVAAAARLERACSDAGVASIVFFTRRFMPDTIEWLRQVAAAGEWDCGRAEFCAAILASGNPFGSSPWRREKGALWDIGPHALSLLWPALGEVVTVQAGAGRGDQVHLVLQHTGGRSSTISVSETVPPAAIGGSVYVYGEAGRLVAAPVSADPARARAAHRAALDALIDQTRHPGAGHACDVHFGARVVEVLAAAEQSLASGHAVQIERSATQ